MLQKQKTAKFLKDLARKQAGIRAIEEVIEILSNMQDCLGSVSLGHKNMSRLAKVLFTTSQPTVMVPTCPDYSHNDGKYDFKTLGSGVPLLAHLNLEFIARMPQCFKGIFLLADQEAYDDKLCTTVCETQETFTVKLRNSRESIQNTLMEGWLCKFMTEMFPSICDFEEAVISDIQDSAELASDTLSRMSMYQKLGVWSVEEATRRTIKTASQYIALAKCIAQSGVIVLNHTTVNLKYYIRYGAPLLHNPVSVY